VWQIAQRDYKFGKGKHASLTKATYDAVAEKFRSLWGKEAGWAQSVLFTANLKAFSERLVAKVEKEEDVVVKQEDGETVVKTVEVEEKVVEKKAKREAEEEDVANVLSVTETVKTRKRRRRGTSHMS